MPVCTQCALILHRVGNTVPHVVDVDWRLDYFIKVILLDHLMTQPATYSCTNVLTHLSYTHVPPQSNHLERVNKPVYLVEFKTEVLMIRWSPLFHLKCIPLMKYSMEQNKAKSNSHAHRRNYRCVRNTIIYKLCFHASDLVIVAGFSVKVERRIQKFREI